MSDTINTMDRRRQPKGQPTGGQFATHLRADADVTLTPVVNTDMPMVHMDEAVNPETPQSRLMEFAAADNWLLSTYVASNPAAGADVLDQASQTDDNGVHYLVGVHPNTGQDTLHRLSRSSLRDTRTAAALNPNLAESDQLRLAEDEDLRVVVAVVETHAHNPAVRDLLHKSKFPVVRERLAKIMGVDASV